MRESQSVACASYMPDVVISGYISIFRGAKSTAEQSFRNPNCFHNLIILELEILILKARVKLFAILVQLSYDYQ